MRQYGTFAVPFVVAALTWGCGDDGPTQATDTRYSISTDTSFVVGDSASLTVANPVGGVSIRPGAAGVVRVQTTKRARHEEDLAKFDVAMTEVAGGLQITSDDPSHLENASVELSITAPADARPAIHVGVGSTSYEGDAQGSCTFQTGVGSVEIRLAADVNVTVDLAVAAGFVQVGFAVQGNVTSNNVNGTIGTGADGTIYARVATGSIKVIRR